MYARVFSSAHVRDLDHQVARVTAWARRRGHAISTVITEIGSGLTGRRRKVLRILSDPTISTILVEHRDRLARVGAEAVKAALAAQGRRIVVVDPQDRTDDLGRDMLEILTAFCARLYGRRGARQRARAALNTARRSA